MHKNAFTPDNAAMLLIDHQIGTMGWTHSHDINLVKTNALKLRAYEIYLLRRGQTGFELEDWLQAERELTS
jgi:hypothetical protein